MDKKNIINIIRLSVSIFLLFILFNKLGKSVKWPMKFAFSGEGLPFLLIAIMFHYLAKLLRVFNLRRLLRVHNPVFSYFKLVKISWISAFFGFFFPATTGADLVRIYHLRKYFLNFSSPATATLVLNICSVFTFAVLALFGTFLSISIHMELSSYFIQAIVVSTTIISVVFLSVMAPQTRKLGMNVVTSDIVSMLGPVQRFLRDLLEKLNAHVITKNIIATLMIAAIVIIFESIRTYFLSRAIGVELSLVYFIIFVPVVALVTLIPISFSGIGLRETTFVALFSSLGVDSGKALTIGLFVTILNISICLIGGIFYLVEVLNTKQ